MSGTVYKRKDGRWVGCVELPIDNGKRRRKYVYSNSQKEVKRKLNKLIYELENNLFKENSNTTFGSMLNQWYTVHSPKLADTTKELYRMYLDKHIIPEIGSIKLKNLKPLHLDKYYNKKLDSLSPNTVIKLHKCIHTALNYAVKNDIVATNISNNVTLPKKIEYTPNIYNEDQFNKLLDTVRGTFDEIPILLAGAIGLRRGEIFGLRWTDLDFKNNTITVEETEVRYSKYLIKDPKSQKSKRTIIAYAFVMSVLKDYLNAFKVVPERVCNEYRPDSYSKHFKKLLKKNGLPHIRFHDLRHYNAILMLKYNIPDKIAAERLGHSDTSMLKKVYQHTLPEMHEDAAHKLEDAFTKADSHFDSQHSSY